jgi:hypothetical protein
MDMKNNTAIDADELEKLYTKIIRSLLIDLTHAHAGLEKIHISWLDTKNLIDTGEEPISLSKKQVNYILGDYKKSAERINELINYCKNGGLVKSL